MRKPVGLAALCLSILSWPTSASSQAAASLEARLQSCNASVSAAAVRETLNDPKGLRDPILLLQAALSERVAGRNQEAAFLYLAARLRIHRQALVQDNEGSQAAMLVVWAYGRMILPTVEGDVALARRVVRRVIDWDRSTPDPVRERHATTSSPFRERLDRIDQAFERIPDKIKVDPQSVADIRARGLQADEQIELIRHTRCSAGTLDSVDLELEDKHLRGRVANFARAHPFVLGEANGSVKSATVVSGFLRANGGRSRNTVSVKPQEGNIFYAEIDVHTTVTPERKLGDVRLALVCTTKLAKGHRDSRWKDVCRDDPNASRPPEEREAK